LIGLLFAIRSALKNAGVEFIPAKKGRELVYGLHATTSPAIGYNFGERERGDNHD